jgi:hypothetical protein
MRPRIYKYIVQKETEEALLLNFHLISVLVLPPRLAPHSSQSGNGNKKEKTRRSFDDDYEFMMNA